MTSREKLVELIEKEYFEWFTVQEPSEKSFGEVVADRLLENGVIVPPCKVGDTIYCDGKYFASHCAGEIMEFPVSFIETNVVSAFRGEIDVQFDFDDFSKTVFLTKKEAEKALAEQESD